MRRWFASLVSTGVVLGACWSVPGVEAQEPLSGGALVSKTDSLAQATLSDGLVSGFSIGVMRGQDLLLAEGYGFADLDHQVPAGPHTVYQMGSITKQFTAAAVMQLVDSETIDLSDPIAKFLPGFDTQGHNVTIRHLLNHTSGVRSYPSDDTPVETLALDVSDEELLARMQAESFDFVPGESYRYSNAGYVLLGMVVAAVSRQSYAQYMEDHVFEPLGMSRSSVCDLQGVTPGRARGYALEGGDFRLVDHDVSTTHMGAAGALCSSVFDLLSWSSALRGGRVVNGASYETMVTPTSLADGTQVPYGFGSEVRARLEGRLSVFHGGGTPGFSSRLDYYPDADLTIAVMSNTYGDHSSRISDAIARWALGIPMPTVLDAQRSVEELETYVGAYRVSNQEWRVVRRGAWLFVEIDDRDPSRLKSQGDQVFVPQYSDFTRITFLVEDGRATGMSLYECQPMNQSLCRTREGSREP